MHVFLLLYHLFGFFQVQDNSPGSKAGLEAFFDFIVAVGTTRLVSTFFDNYFYINFCYLVF